MLIHPSQPRQSGCSLCFWQYRISLEKGDFRYSLIPSLWWRGFKSLWACGNINDNYNGKICNQVVLSLLKRIFFKMLSDSENTAHTNILTVCQCLQCLPIDTYWTCESFNQYELMKYLLCVSPQFTSLWAAQYFISHTTQYTLAVLCGFPFLAQVSQNVGFSKADGRSSTENLSVYDTIINAPKTVLVAQ